MTPPQQPVSIRDLQNMVLNHLPFRIFWKDWKSTYLGCNQLFAEDACLNCPDEVVGKTDFDFPWGSSEAESYRADDKQVMETRESKLNYEESQLRENGVTWLRTSKIPLMDDSGEVVGVLGTYEDITERKEAEFELIKLRKQAEAANLAKTEFLCRMSHDLRTPLNSILGNAQMLEIASELGAQDQACLAQIQRSGDELHQLVSGILEMTQIESGSTKLKIETCKLYELLQEGLQQYTALAKEKGLGLRLEADINLPNTIETDAMKLRRIMGNLVGNALKFTSEGGVRVTAGAVDGNLHVDVIDTGIGIAKEKLGTIFAPFSQVNGSTSNKDGVGLGLAICLRFADMLGGTVSVESQLGEGSTFRLRLPLSYSETSAPDNITIGEEPAEPEIQKKEKGLRVLVVDDHPPNRKLLQCFLDHVGMDVQEATNGAEALELFQSFKPEVILMDIRMPVMDGLEATRIIRGKAPDKPCIIAVSGEAFDEVQGEAMEAGCNAYIVKPVCLKLLLSTIQEFSDRARGSLI